MMPALNAPIGPQHLIWAGGSALLLAWAITPLIRRVAVAAGCVSRPSADRWGRRAIARLGGIPIALSFLGAAAWAAASEPRWIWLCAAGGVALLTGLADDILGLRPYVKLIAQITAACFAVLAGIQADLPAAVGWAGVPLTVVWLVLVMNAFNLLDNMDGLSAGIGMIAAFFCAWQAAQSGQFGAALVAASVGGATLGFLRYNLPPAKIFMGDTGSQVLGLGLGAAALMGTWHHSTRLVGMLFLPTLLLAVPIFDTLFVTVQRLLHGRNPFRGGTDHLSHRLCILGLNTRQVVFILYGLAVLFGSLSLFLSFQNVAVVTGVWLLAMVLLLLLGAYLSRVRVYAAEPSPALAESSSTTWVETMLLHKRRILEVCLDFVLICAAYLMAHALRFEAAITRDLEVLILRSLPWIIPIKMVCFVSCGAYRGLWRYTSLADMVNLFRAVFLSSVFSALTLLYLWRFEGYSRAVFIIDGLLLFVLMGGARVAERLLNDWIRSALKGVRPVLIIGAGDTGELVLRQIKQGLYPNRRAAAFLDDDPHKQGKRIHGVPVQGTRRELGRVVQTHGIEEVLVCIPDPPPDLVRQIQGYCEENHIAWKVSGSLPSGPLSAAP